MKKVINRQTIIIHHNLTTSKEWYENLDLSFTPDRLIVRDVSYAGSAVISEVIHCVIVPFINSRENILCTFGDDQFHTNPGTIFNINRGKDLLNGSQKFTINDLDDGISAGTGDKPFSITLEFQEHEKERDPEKIFNQNGNGASQSCAVSSCDPFVDIHPEVSMDEDAADVPDVKISSNSEVRQNPSIIPLVSYKLPSYKPKLESIKEEPVKEEPVKEEKKEQEGEGDISKIQSILFNKNKYSKERAEKWMTKHNLVPILPVDDLNDNYKYSVADPEAFKKFITKDKGNIKVVIGVK